MIWNGVACLAFAVVVYIVVRHVRRHSDSDLDMIQRQLNCPHLYTYRSGGKRRCAKCGKEQVPEKIYG